MPLSMWLLCALSIIRLSFARRYHDCSDKREDDGLWAFCLTLSRVSTQFGTKYIFC